MTSTTIKHSLHLNQSGTIPTPHPQDRVITPLSTSQNFSKSWNVHWNKDYTIESSWVGLKPLGAPCRKVAVEDVENVGLGVEE